MAGFQARTTHHVAARTGLGFEVAEGDLIRITDLEGSQPVDFWAFCKDDIYEHLSCEHTRPSISKLCPQCGDSAYTTRRRKIVTMIEDNSPGEHDMQYAACDRTRYVELGADESHANCQDNLHIALETLGLSLPYSPQPWNLFTNFFVHPDGTMEIRAPSTKAGDNLVLRAEMPAYIVVSACPQDLNSTCGGQPTDIRIELGG